MRKEGAACRPGFEVRLGNGEVFYAYVRFEIRGLAEAREPMGSDGDRSRGCTFHTAVYEEAAVFVYGI